MSKRGVVKVKEQSGRRGQGQELRKADSLRPPGPSTSAAAFQLAGEFLVSQNSVCPGSPPRSSELPGDRHWAHSSRYPRVLRRAWHLQASINI